jgi:hypothetical protein
MEERKEPVAASPERSMATTTGGLAAAAAAHQGGDGGGLGEKRDVVQDFDRLAFVAIGLGNSAEIQTRWGHGVQVLLY